MKRHWMLAAVVSAVVALLAGACGSLDSEPDSGVGKEIPVNSNPDDTVVAESLCAPGEPDCSDTIVVPDKGQDLPLPDGEPATAGGEVSTGMPVNGGLTISEALATEATGILAVRGYGFEDADGVRLCESLAPGGERYDCGGPSIVVEHLDLNATGIDIVIHDGISYTDGEVTVFGELIDGVLVLDGTVMG